MRLPEAARGRVRFPPGTRARRGVLRPAGRTFVSALRASSAVPPFGVPISRLMSRSPWPRVALLLAVLAAVAAAPVAAQQASQPAAADDSLVFVALHAIVALDSAAAPPLDSLAMDSTRAAPPSVVLRAPGVASLGFVGLGGGMSAGDSLRRSGRTGLFERPTDGFEPVRFGAAVGTLAALDAGLMLALSDLWYTSRVPWHWYSDAPAETGIPDDGWLDDWHTYAQMDKAGHAFTTWHFARGAGRVGRWTGMSDRAAGWFGGIAAIASQSQIEFFDGYDATYGASRTDLLANVVGGIIGGVRVAHPEKTAWFDSRVSYHPSPYYDETISGIGNSLKDYDGTSYWLVAFPSDLGAPRWWPAWLGASLGYGADGLAHPVSGIGVNGAPNGPVHRREYYLSLDVDLLRTGRVPRVLRPAVWFLSFLRVPMPALQFGPAGTRLHPLYY